MSVVQSPAESLHYRCGATLDIFIIIIIIILILIIIIISSSIITIIIISLLMSPLLGNLLFVIHIITYKENKPDTSLFRT
jgi:uncharacterized protein YqhQ